MPDLSYEILCSSCRTPMPSTSVLCPACGHAIGRGVVSPLAVDTPPAPSVSASAANVPTALLTPGLRADGSREYGGFGIRVAAAVVDDVLLLVPLYLLYRSFGLYALPAALIGWLYFPIMESSGAQATVGKIAFGLIVTDTAYRRISFGRAVGRHFAKILSALVIYLGYVMVAITPTKRGLHDYVAGTLVLRV